MDSDELIGQGHTPQWVLDQQARMSAPRQKADAKPGDIEKLANAVLPLSELGMYGQSMDGLHGWCLCSLCQRPVGGPAPDYGRPQAITDLAAHLRIAHGAK